MFNYANLNDVEFEELAKDVISRMLKVQLRSFAQGKDGGIDLTDNVKKHNIVVQVKHYDRSPFSNLRRSLVKEVENVISISPLKYYICCSQKLTPENIHEIYMMFSKYMESDKNIITITEIDDFLSRDENFNIVSKHFKLWLESSNVLSKIFNNNILIDCETLLCDIQSETKFFVKTSIYEQCIHILEKNCALLLIGMPGVGKSITSKMLVLNFIAQGYKVKYTTNGDITDLKRAITADKNSKEIILLDDCLGQHYFTLKSETENELVSLIKYVNMNKNKILILNSRVTIYNQAKNEFEELDRILQKKKINIYEMDMNNINLLDKAKIFYNHLYFKNIKKEYFDDIKEDKNYLKILCHKNYNPRIIDYVTMEVNYSHVRPEKYSEYILDSLNNPKDIWKNEYNNYNGLGNLDTF